MPVANATAERSLSVVRCMKTYVRSTMKNDRLSSLGLMHIHRDFEHEGQILNKFKKLLSIKVKFIKIALDSMLYETLKWPQIAPFCISSKTKIQAGEGGRPRPTPVQNYGVHTIKPQLRPCQTSTVEYRTNSSTYHSPETKRNWKDKKGNEKHTTLKPKEPKTEKCWNRNKNNKSQSTCNVNPHKKNGGDIRCYRSLSIFWSVDHIRQNAPVKVCEKVKLRLCQIRDNEKSSWRCQDSSVRSKHSTDLSNHDVFHIISVVMILTRAERTPGHVVIEIEKTTWWVIRIWKKYIVIKFYPRFENYSNFLLVKTPAMKKKTLHYRVLLGYTTGVAFNIVAASLAAR